MDLQGNIEKFTLPEILQLIATSRKSGTLGIQRDESIVMIYFQSGEVIYGYGPRQTYHVGQLLRERGIITARQLDEAVKVQSKSDNTRRLGEIMIARDFVDRADLEAVIKEQVEELLYSLLSWQSGSFKFYEDQFPTEEEITVSLSVENIILEGLRRLDEQTMVAQTLSDFSQVYGIAASHDDRTRAVTMKANEWNVMALVDGRRSIDEICAASQLPREETVNRLAQLKLAGIITTVDADQKECGAYTLERMVNRLSGLFESYLTEKEGIRPEGSNRIASLNPEHK